MNIYISNCGINRGSTTSDRCLSYLYDSGSVFFGKDINFTLQNFKITNESRIIYKYVKQPLRIVNLVSKIITVIVRDVLVLPYRDVKVR